MSIRDIETLKSLFNTGDYLLESSFVDLIDTLFAQSVPAPDNLAPAYLGQVSTSGLFPNQMAAASKQAMSRTAHFARDWITSLKLIFPNRYAAITFSPSNGSEASAGSAPTLLQAAVEYPLGVFTRVKFASADQVSSTAAEISSDFCDVAIPSGAQFWIRCWRSNADGVIFCDYPNNGNGFVVSNTTTPNLVMGGTVASHTTNGFGPTAIIGMTRKPTLLLIGDSSVAGRGDTPGTTLNMGFFARCIGNDLGYINLGVPSDRASFAKNNYALRSSFAQYCSHILCNYGANDLLNGASVATILADLQSIYTISAFSGKPIRQSTVKPTGVTGTYTSDAGQTAHSTNPARIDLNDALRDGVANLKGYIDIAQVLESPTKSGVWATDRGGNALTDDGFHALRRGTMRVQASGILHPGMFLR